MSKKRLKNVCSEADHAILQERYEFIPSEKKATSWQDRMVKKYDASLYREYAIADLTRSNRLGLRWRTRQEVESGRGERTCGNRTCYNDVGLVTLEVPFSYVERGIKKKELVKLCLCPRCKPLVETKSSRGNNSTQQNNDEVTSSSDDSSRRGGKKRRKTKYKSDDDSDDDTKQYKKRKKRHKSRKRSHSKRKER